MSQVGRGRSESSAATRDLLSATTVVTDDIRRKEFREMFEGATSRQHFYDRLKARGLKGLKNSSIRSIYWRVFLQVLTPTGTDDWLTEIRKSREEFEVLEAKNMVNPSTGGTQEDLRFNNPLSTAKDSPWSQYFQDNEIANSIRLDLERTYPDHAFFQQEDVQASMLSILFIWAKLNPIFGYRQGMNEILAPIVFIFHRDSREKKSEDGDDDLLSTLLDDRYIQHDVWSCFRKIMVVMAQYFGIKPVPVAAKVEAKKSTVVGVITPSFFTDAAETEHKPPPESPIVTRSNYIHHQLLAQCDPGLYGHLQRIGIQPQLYLLRWVRLLFSREFHIEDVVLLWDAIFAYNDATASFSVTVGFKLVDYIAISMCLFVRNSLLEGDESFCLSRFLKFPPVEDVSVFIERALILLNPRVYAPLPPALARTQEDTSRDAQQRTPYVSIGPSVVHDYREIANSSSREDESTSKKLIGALTKLNPFNKDKKKDIINAGATANANNKYAASIVHTSATGQGAPPQPSIRDRQITALNAKVGQLTRLMNEMGNKLDLVSTRLLTAQNECEDKKTPFSTDLVYQTIAEVKHVRDVLSGRISASEALAHLQATSATSPSQQQQQQASSAASGVLRTSAAVPSNEPLQRSISPPVNDDIGNGRSSSSPIGDDEPSVIDDTPIRDTDAVSSTSPVSTSTLSPSTSAAVAVGGGVAGSESEEPSDSLFMKSGAHKFGGSSPPVSSKLKALFSDDDPTDGLFGMDPRDRAPVTAISPPSSSSSSSNSAVSSSVVASLFGADEDPLFGLVGRAKPVAVARTTGPL